MSKKVSKLEKEAKAYEQKSMSKKALAERNKAQRGTALISTATKTFKSAKDYNRQAHKQDTRKALAWQGTSARTHKAHRQRDTQRVQQQSKQTLDKTYKE